MSSKTTSTPIIKPTAVSRGNPGRWKVLAVAAVTSLLAHFIALPVFLLFNFSNAETPESLQVSVVVAPTFEKETEEPPIEADTVNITPGPPKERDPDQPPEVPVPGLENPDGPFGMQGGARETSLDLQPPPGFEKQGWSGSFPGKLSVPGAVEGGTGLVPEGFRGRVGSQRGLLVERDGGTTQSEAAVGAGLKWLHLHQAPDGRWSLDGFSRQTRRELSDGKLTATYERCNCTGPGQENDIAGTGLGLLPLLGAGHTHKGVGGKFSLYNKDVERGLKFLILKQNSQGDFGGGMYSHALATIAMCEAYGLTSDPALRRPAQQALNFIVRAQSAAGGWSYTAPCTGHDTSVGGWQLMALKSGQMSGLDIPPKTLSGASHWLDDVASPDGSGYGYQSPGPTPSMTAVGLLCRMYLGWGPRNPGLQKGVELLKKTPPRAIRNLYYYYYATQVMHHFDGESWQSWNPPMRDWLIATQDKGIDPNHGHQRGSWDPRGDAWGPQGGRLMVTSLSLLTLEVYYRHLPLYRREMGGGK